MTSRGLVLGATVALALAAAPAQAADVLVLGRDGATARRADPGVAGRDRAPAPRASLRPVASAASGRTVSSELRRLYREHQIDRSAYDGYRGEYGRDKALAGRLTGRRRLEVAGVLGTMDRMAASGSLTASRLVPLWLQLRRNREWWTTGPLLAAGQRVSFKGSELVFQYVPGEGLQIHPLANFGKLNALWRSRLEADRMRKLMNELLAIPAGRAGGIAWEYYFDFGGGRPPWVSGLAQGTGLQSLARASSKAGVSDLVFPRLRRGLRIFRTAPPSGIRVRADGGIHYAQYSFAPGLRILNGFVQSLVGLYDFAMLADDPTARRLFREGDVAARREVPTYDTGAWSLYSRGTVRHESDRNYHGVLIDFLTSLCDRTHEAVYCTAVDRFRRYLREDPRVRLLTSRLRAGSSGALRFRLSKVSRVGVQLRRGDKLVYAYAATLGYGTRSLTIKPPRYVRRYDVRITATDLAGNAASENGTIEVLPPSG
ncbi:MAG: D-glucuronyl C5-epimerase family protein [Solirubrobacteraceae bacterium]